MKSWLKNKFRVRKKSQFRIESSSVETGRASYRYDDQDKRQRKNLIRKLNRYWGGTKDSLPTSYQKQAPSSGRRKLLLAFLLICAALLFLNSGGFSLFSVLLEDIDYFKITEISVEGTVNSAVDEIRADSGITVGSSLFSVDVQEVNNKVKKQNLWVDQVRISRRWPDTIILRIEEYKPHALITVGKGEPAQLYYLDKKGNVFIKTSFGMDLDFPVITGLEDVDELDRMADGLGPPLELLRLAGTNNPNLPVQSISELNVDDQAGLILYLVEHPFPIFMGDDEIKKKYIRLRKVLEMLYKPRRTGMDIGRVAYIKMDYLEDKVIVGYGESG
ncbi:MAG: FtsQ-type POTRA domain-containing protein [Desulfofustis sp.]|jgi:cell division protein FtsQ